MPTVGEQLRHLRSVLQAVSAEADSEAKLILAHVYGTTPGALIMRLLHEADCVEEADEIAAARLEGRPLAYILKSSPFFGADYEVDERVLIPRFDTEPVVEAALKRIAQRGYRTAADVCCGSGCIGTTLLRESALEKVICTDISPGALEVAAGNAARLAPGRCAEFRQGDLLAVLDEQVDMIVCNPPYITEAEFAGLERQVRDFEPSLALLGGPDGLDFYRRLAAEAPARLQTGGTLLVEIGSEQESAVRELFACGGLAETESGRDLAGRPRWVAGVRC